MFEAVNEVGDWWIESAKQGGEGEQNIHIWISPEERILKIWRRTHQEDCRTRAVSQRTEEGHTLTNI